MRSPMVFDISMVSSIQPVWQFKCSTLVDTNCCFSSIVDLRANERNRAYCVELLIARDERARMFDNVNACQFVFPEICR